MNRMFYGLAVLFLVSCSTVKVTMDYDSAVDFTQYKTYTIAEEINELPLNDLDRRRLISAIEAQMEIEGFTKSDNPDLILDVLLNTKEETQATANTTYMGGYGRYGYRYGGGMTTTSVNYSTYTVGTIFFNLVDAKKNELVWQGIAEGTVNDNPKGREERLKSALEKVFAQYPPVSK